MLFRSMLVHSYIYYVMDTNIISDDKWQDWANELVELQNMWFRFKAPKTVGFYDDVFQDWNGSTGMHLPKDEWIQKKAKKLVLANKRD